MNQDSKYLITIKKISPTKLLYYIEEDNNTCNKLRKVKRVYCYDKKKGHSPKSIIDQSLLKKIEQTFIEKYKKEISQLGFSNEVFIEPTIDMDAIHINETIIDGNKVMNITVLADVEEIVNVEGKNYYYNMALPFSITKIGLGNSTDCPSSE